MTKTWSISQGLSFGGGDRYKNSYVLHTILGKHILCFGDRRGTLAYGGRSVSGKASWEEEIIEMNSK